MENAIKVTSIVTYRLTKFGMPIDVIDIILKFVFEERIKTYNLDRKLFEAISETSAFEDHNICLACAKKYDDNYTYHREICLSCCQEICFDCYRKCERCDDIYCKICISGNSSKQFICGTCEEQKYCDNCKEFRIFEDCPHCMKLYELYEINNKNFEFCVTCHDCIFNTNPYASISKFPESYGSDKKVRLTPDQIAYLLNILALEFDIKINITSAGENFVITAESPSHNYSGISSRKIWRSNEITGPQLKLLTFLRWLVEVVFELKFEGSKLDLECRKFYM